MTPEEAVACVTYINQIDPRVQLNPATSDLWWYAIESLRADQVRWAIKDYYATANPNSNGGVPPLTPATLKHRLAGIREQTASKQRALEPPARITNPMSFRKNDPERWERLYREGRDKHRADLQARGIPLTAWQTSADKRPDAYNHNP